MSTFLGIDLGGTKIAAALVDSASGALRSRAAAPTDSHEGPEAVMARMARLALDVCAAAGERPADVSAVGVGVPGLYDLATGRTVFLPNLVGAWRGVPVGESLRAALDRPVWLINDARAFVLAEARFGAGRGAQTVVGLTLGTGVGGGIVVGGRLHLGLDGTGGECGHQTIDPNGPPCGCGNRGCLESFASGPSIAALGMRAVAQNMTTSIAQLAGQDLNRITPEVIGRAAESGDAVAREILARAGTALGVGVANLITILSPERVVLGGSVARLGQWLLGPVHDEVRRRCHVTPLDRVQIVTAALDDAGIIGAAAWAEHQHGAAGP